MSIRHMDAFSRLTNPVLGPFMYSSVALWSRVQPVSVSRKILV